MRRREYRSTETGHHELCDCLGCVVGEQTKRLSHSDWIRQKQAELKAKVEAERKIAS